MNLLRLILLEKIKITETNRLRSQIFFRNPELESISAEHLQGVYLLLLNNKMSLKILQLPRKLYHLKIKLYIKQASKRMMQKPDLLWETLLTLILNPQLEARSKAALNADDCFLNHGKESTGLTKEDEDLIIGFFCIFYLFLVLI